MYMTEEIPKDKKKDKKNRKANDTTEYDNAPMMDAAVFVAVDSVSSCDCSSCDCGGI